MMIDRIYLTLHTEFQTATAFITKFCVVPPLRWEPGIPRIGSALSSLIIPPPTVLIQKYLLRIYSGLRTQPLLDFTSWVRQLHSATCK